MEQKNNVFMLVLSGIMMIVVICLVIMIIRPQTDTSHLTGSIDTYNHGIVTPSFPNEMNIKTNVPGEQIVSLGGNRFAVIDSNPDSGNHGTILVFEYDEKARKIHFLASDNYVARMNQRTE
ncbi:MULTISPECIES: hypothetical protein [Paenibacillus]|uniref:Uncharacterized protein n=1 Tax=Paenibacillus albilobatus TaxID=2716884 RepID=A0A919XNI7_9BACL|nr:MULTISPECIES: hypothetical protein [Paenibacillus]MDR9857218.1 hypothetical protein [Paenibacillus sp. VCA1]GIO34673.1 hypothetical protein J2TS6_58140 [Paenibacillus albilobatus]